MDEEIRRLERALNQSGQKVKVISEEDWRKISATLKTYLYSDEKMLVQVWSAASGILKCRYCNTIFAVNSQHPSLKPKHEADCTYANLPGILAKYDEA